MHLEVAVGTATVTITEPRDLGAYPYLTSVGALAVTARATHLEGIGLTEAPSIVVVLDNTDRQAARLLGYPLRARATVYGDDGGQLFSGLVQSIALGPELTLGIES